MGSKNEKKLKNPEKALEKKEKKAKKEKKEKLNVTEKKSQKDKKDHEDKKDKKEKKEKKEKKNKKEKKERKRKHSESESEEEFVIHKRNKVANPVVESITPQATAVATTGWNDWSKAAFDGDNAKKDKFMRLLGAKKSAQATTQAFVPAKKAGGGLYGSLKSAIDEDEKKRISNDLEKQFDHGLQFRKQMQMGRRGGLGFN